jgi:hypothetical protein
MDSERRATSRPFATTPSVRRRSQTFPTLQQQPPLRNDAGCDVVRHARPGPRARAPQHRAEELRRPARRRPAWCAAHRRRAVRAHLRRRRRAGTSAFCRPAFEPHERNLTRSITTSLPCGSSSPGAPIVATDCVAKNKKTQILTPPSSTSLSTRHHRPWRRATRLPSTTWAR